ncbi:DUF3470 domain-containing protein [Achromobacter xylosoxidans]|uniref:DUF3470 domain-containing protein n=1 Tax=Alcaligenes xylosoxydans xylosoxydans TaxID=85698 RepID=UPI003D215156
MRFSPIRNPGLSPGWNYAAYVVQWSNITRKGAVSPDADVFNGMPDKYHLYFSPRPGRAKP